jgi:hypothetical protein
MRERRKITEEAGYWRTALGWNKNQTGHRQRSGAARVKLEEAAAMQGEQEGDRVVACGDAAAACGDLVRG